MTGVDALRTLLRSWLILALGALVGALVSSIAVLLAPVSYQASTTLFVSVSPARSVNDLNQGSAFAEEVVRSYVAVIPTSYILDPVRTGLHLRGSVAQLAHRVDASAAIDTTVISVTVTAPTAAGAAATADAIAARVVDAAPELTPSTTSRAAATVRIVQHAVPPTSPTSPTPTKDLLVGVVVGVAAALLLVVLRNRLRTRAIGVSEVEADAGASVLGLFPRQAFRGARKEDVPADAERRRLDGIRVVYTNLLAAEPPRSSAALLITSAVAGEARTAFAVLLAEESARAGSRTLLVDAAVRNPTLAEYLQLRPSSALREYLQHERGLTAAVRQLDEDRLAVLASELAEGSDLSDEAQRRLLRDAADSFDRVLLLGPPLLESGSAYAIAASAAGVILTCAPRVSRRADIRAAADGLARAGARLMGVAITRTPRRFDGPPIGPSRRRRND